MRVIESRDDTSGDKGRTVGLLRGTGSVLLDSLGNVCREETGLGPYESQSDGEAEAEIIKRLAVCCVLDCVDNRLGGRGSAGGSHC